MKAWWIGLDERDRRMVQLGGALLAALLIYMLAWQPFTHRLHDLEEDVSNRRSTLNWIVGAAGEVLARRGAAGPSRGNLGDRSLLVVVDSSARAAGLGPALKRMEPEGGDSARVWLDNVSFDDMIGWFAELDRRYGVIVRTVTIERRAEAGRADARVTLEGPAE